MQRIAIALTIWLAALVSAAAQQPAADPAKPAKATFAGGCFWCNGAPLRQAPRCGLSRPPATSAARKKNPTYEEVSAGGTGHAEAVQVVYDPSKVTYAELLDVFWHNIDPLTADAQFCDHGERPTVRRHLLSRRCAAQAGGAKASVAALEQSTPFKRAGGQPDVAAGRRLLQGRGLSPGLPHQESAPVQVLPLQLRA